MQLSRVRHYLPNGCTVLAVVLLGANYINPFGDLDYAWQIRTGELIVHTGTLRPPESFTYTIAGEPIPDFEWLYEVILYAVWEALGYGGLKLLKTALVIAPLVLVAWRLRCGGVRWHGIALALGAAILAISPAWNLRPMACTTVGLLLVTGWLHDHCTGKRPLTWWLPPVMLLWSNLHPGVILGQGVLVGAIAWEWLNARVRLNAPLDRARLWRLTRVGGLGVAATFLAPDPVERFLYPFKPELAHPIMRMFGEMQPLHTFFAVSPLTTVVPYAVAALVGLTVVLRFRQYRLWEVATLVSLGGLANLAFRSVQDWLLVMLALGVPHLTALLGDAARHRRRAWAAFALRLDLGCRRLLDNPLMRFQAGWLSAALAVLAVASLIPPLARAMPVQDDPEWPRAATARIEELNLSGRFFGPPDYGAYLTWRVPGRARTYTDTRGFFFPPRLLEDSHYIPQLGPDWRARLDRVLDEYHTDYFLVEVSGPRGELWRRLRPHVDGPPLHIDERAVLLSAGQVRAALVRLDRKALAPAEE
ncbi:MAG: hypothetical protein IT429_04735 [Gemmataceae bacterium]|nr:hypothetical protein [Gemmataceae bacterium]